MVSGSTRLIMGMSDPFRLRFFFGLSNFWTLFLATFRCLRGLLFAGAKGLAFIRNVIL